MNRLPQFSIAHPRIILGLWLIIMMISGFFALKLDGALTAGGFTNPRAEAITTQQVVEQAFGDAPNQVLIAVEAEKSITATEIEGLGAELTALGADSIQTPLTNPAWQSNDGKTAVLAAGFLGDNTEIQNLTPDLQQSLSESTEARIYVTGQPALDYNLNVHSKEDAVRAELIVFPLLIIILLIIFRSVAATAVPLVLAGSALAVSYALGYLVTRLTDISLLYTNIVSMIGLAVAVDYSLFIIKRYREELSHGHDISSALSTAFNTAGRSVVFSGIAVVVALSALFIPNLMAFTSIALGGIVVTLSALLLTMTVLPAGLKLLDRRIEWGTLKFLPAPRIPLKTRGKKNPGVVASAGALMMLLMAMPMLGISLQSPVASASVLPADDSARIGLERIEQNIGHEGLFPIQVVLTASNDVSRMQTLQSIQQVTDEVERLDPSAIVRSVLTSGISQAELAKALESSVPEPLASLWSNADNSSVTRIVIDPSAGPDTVFTHELIKELRASLAGIAPSADIIGVTGATAQGIDFDNTLVSSIPWILALVFLLTYAMLLIAFKSALLPLIALAFNTLVVMASVGLLTAFVDISGQAPMNSVTPILLFAVMFGLSMDYMVIIISRIIEAYKNGLAYNDAIEAGTTQTRSMINSAALIMVAVFVAFTSAQISIVREIGIGLAIAVILDAVVIRSIIMPAVLRLMGPRALGRRIQREGEPVKNSDSDEAIEMNLEYGNLVKQ
ncbi:MMPL family transporter [Arthrobacter sp. lap29]|uniref:MMPL family transporter n=1 Tax=Arthrobacter sp. lap29 TaxID=3056122 RepID=UPI0028F721B5|nr:MMPL family transporter [Arthrobacter sp. lap29]